MSFCLDTTLVNCLKGLKPQNSLFLSLKDGLAVAPKKYVSLTDWHLQFKRCQRIWKDDGCASFWRTCFYQGETTGWCTYVKSKELKRKFCTVLSVKHLCMGSNSPNVGLLYSKENDNAMSYRSVWVNTGYTRLEPDGFGCGSSCYPWALALVLISLILHTWYVLNWYLEITVDWIIHFATFFPKGRHKTSF